MRSSDAERRSRVARAPSGACAPRRSATGRRRARRDVGTCGDRLDDRLEALRRRGAAEREERQRRRAPGRSTHWRPETSIPCPIGTTLRDAQRERALVDGEDARREPRRRPRAGGSRRQCVNQSSTSTAERTRDAAPRARRRWGTCARARPRARACARARERAPTRSGGRGRRGDASRRGARGSCRAARPRPRVSASTTSSSTRAGERPELRDGRAEHGARRVDLLGDEDEPHARAATARSTSSATSLGVLVRRVRPVVRARHGRRRRAAARAPRSERIRTRASAIASGRSGIDEQARLVVPDDVGDAAGARADHGAAAAERLEHDARRAPPSATASSSSQASSSAAHDVGRLERGGPTSTWSGRSRTSASATSVVAPVADEPQPRAGTRGAARRHASASDVDVLVALEHADEERDRALGQRRDRRLRERASGRCTS